MPKFRVILQMSGIAGDNPAAVRTALDEQLRKSGLENCRVVTVEPEGMRARPGTPPVAVPAEPAWRREANAGGLLLVAAAAWALWFFWWMFSSGAE